MRHQRQANGREGSRGGGTGGGGVVRGIAQAAAGRYKLQELRLGGFKSFKSSTRVVLGNDGLTCITGPNGSGKSTLLNAILFGLGEHASQLGARQNAELASAAHAQVELLFRSVSRGVNDVKVSSSVSRADGVRTYAFNGQKLPKRRFDHFLRTRLGIATGNPFWRVSQDGIHRLLQASPGALHDTLCEVSGTKAINAHRSTALKQLVRWRRSLADIQTNLAALEEAVGREGAHLLAMDRVRELTAELDAIPAEMEALDREIAEAEHLAAERLLDRLGSDVEVLEKDKRDAEELVRGLQAKVAKLGGGEGGENGGADDSDRGGTGGSEVEVLQRELSLTLTDLAKVSTEVKLGQAALREKEELDTKWVEILLAAKAERADLESRSAAMRGRGAVLRERRARLQDEVDRGRAQLVAAAAGDGSPSCASGLDAARRALDDHEASVKIAESRWSAASASVSRAEAEVQEHGYQVASARAAVDEARTVWERMRQIGSPLHAAEDAEKYLRGIKDQRHFQRERQLDLSRLVESSRQGLAAAASRMGAPRWCSQLAVANNTCGGGDGGGNGGNGHRSFLFELFEIRRAHSHETTTAATTPHSQALASLLAGSLSVWVCDSSKHADQALDLAKANSAGLRVWPIDRLRAASKARRGQGRSGRVRQALEWAERKWPGQVKVTDPASLLRWDEGDDGVTAAMEKALGAWLITADDETSAVVLRELGMGSVTVLGVRHAPGEVVGGEEQGEGARLVAKRDWDVANRARKQGEVSLEACAEGCRDLTRKLEAGAEFARLQAQRAVLKKEVHEYSERLLESERKAAGARQKLEGAGEERLRLKQQSAPLGQGSGKEADPEEVLAALKRAVEGREEDLNTTRAASEQLDKEIGLLAEASMEAIERENNAREALGMNIGNNSNSNSNNSGGTNGTEDDDDDDQEQVGRGGGGSGGADADEKDAVSERLAAMKRAVETKIAHVAELERSRDELMVRVGEATLREKGAGERLSALEEKMAEATAAAADSGGRLKAKRKAVKEAERRTRSTASRVRLLAERGRAEADNSSSRGAGSSERSTARTARPAAASAAAAAAAAAAGGVRGWEDEGSGAGNGNGNGNDKENVPKNVPVKLSDELLAKKHELAAKEKLLSSELRSLRRRSDEYQTNGTSGRGSGRRGRPAGGAASQAVVVAGSVDEVTVRKRRAKVGVLKQQLASVVEGARQLEAGVKACEGRMHEANEAAYASVRGELRTLFGAVCVNKSADLVMIGTKLEDGLRLVVRNENTQAAAAASIPPAAVAERSPQELSGGQQALLGLALVLALSSYQSPPLCLLDEVDAALDETNQTAAARLVAMTFREGQALCVSHHAEFHRQSGHCVAVEMRDGISGVRQT